MSYALLLAACALTAFALVNGATSAIVAVAWRERAATWSRRGSAWLLSLRLFPAVFSTAFVAVAYVPSFLAHERRDGVESVSLLLGGAACLGLAVLLCAAGRAAASWRGTRRLVRAWRGSARALAVPGWSGAAYSVEGACPGVFVAGWRRPVLFVARGVEAACTPNELAAIAAHEAAHVTARDNLKKLLLRGLPDLLGWLGAGAEIENAWSAAVEDEADAATLRADRGRGVELASAIVKVSRLVHGAPARLALGSPLAEGPIERRVLRLAGRETPDPGPAAAPSRLPWLAWIALPALFPLHPPLAGSLHAVTEAVVRLLGS